MEWYRCDRCLRQCELKQVNRDNVMNVPFECPYRLMPDWILLEGGPVTISIPRQTLADLKTLFHAILSPKIHYSENTEKMRGEAESVRKALLLLGIETLEGFVGSEPIKPIEPH